MTLLRLKKILFTTAAALFVAMTGVAVAADAPKDAGAAKPAAAASPGTKSASPEALSAEAAECAKLADPKAKDECVKAAHAAQAAQAPPPAATKTK